MDNSDRTNESYHERYENSLSSNSLAEDTLYNKDRNYRRYSDGIDRCLQQFDAVNEWAGVISFLSRLLRILQQFVQYDTIPKKLTMSKRLAQCLNPALPSGVHQKTIEVYNQIFSNYNGSNKFVDDLPLWSYGLFPHMQNASMSNKPAILDLYDKYFFKLGQLLQPSTKGMILALLPNLDEDGNEYFDRTLDMIFKLSECVGNSYFSTCMWLSIIDMPTQRFAAMNYLIRKMPKIRSEEDAVFILGGDKGLLLRALCVTLKDSNLLVQRCALNLLLTHFPIDGIFQGAELYELVITALSVILKRDMSLNRRIFSWILDKDGKLSVKNRKILALSFKFTFDIIHQYNNGYKNDNSDYFQAHNDDHDKPEINGNFNVQELIRIIISLQDKKELGPQLMDDTLLLIIDCVYKIKRSNYSLKDNENSLYSKPDNDVTHIFIELLNSLQPYALFGRFCNTILYPDNFLFDKSVKDIFSLIGFSVDTMNLLTDEIQMIHLPYFAYTLSRKIANYLLLLKKENNNDLLKVISSSILLLNKLIVSIDQRVANLDVPLSKILSKDISLEEKRNNINYDKSINSKFVRKGSVDEIIASSKNNNSLNLKERPFDKNNWSLYNQIDWFYTLPESELTNITSYPQIHLHVGRPVIILIVDNVLLTYKGIIEYGTNLDLVDGMNNQNSFTIQIISNLGSITQKLFTYIDNIKDNLSNNNHNSVNRKLSQKRTQFITSNNDSDLNLNFHRNRNPKMSLTMHEFTLREDFDLWVNQLCNSCIHSKSELFKLENSSKFLDFRSNGFIPDSLINNLDTFILLLFKNLWELIDPMKPVFHTWIVDNIYLSGKIYGFNILQDWLCKEFSSSNINYRTKLYTQFGIFWKVSNDSVKYDSVSMIFTKCLFYIIDSINCGIPSLERTGRNWIRYNLNSILSIIIPLTNILFDSNITVSKSIANISGDDIDHFICSRPFNYNQINYSLKLLSKLILLDEFDELNKPVNDYSELSNSIYGHLEYYNNIMGINKDKDKNNLKNVESTFTTVLTIGALRFIQMYIPQKMSTGTAYYLNAINKDDELNPFPLEFQKSAFSLLEVLISKNAISNTFLPIISKTILEKLRLSIKFGFVDDQNLSLTFLLNISSFTSETMFINIDSNMLNSYTSPSKIHLSPNRSLESKTFPSVSNNENHNTSRAFNIVDSTNLSFFSKTIIEGLTDVRARSIIHLWLDVFVSFLPHSIISYKKSIIPVIRFIIESINKSSYSLHSYLNAVKSMNYGINLNANGKNSNKGLISASPIKDDQLSPLKSPKVEKSKINYSSKEDIYSDLNLFTLFNCLSNSISIIVGSQYIMDNAIDNMALQKECQNYLNNSRLYNNHFLQGQVNQLKNMKYLLVLDSIENLDYKTSIKKLSDEVLNMIPKIVFMSYRVFTIISSEISKEKSTRLLNKKFNSNKDYASIEAINFLTHTGTIASHFNSQGNSFYFAFDIETTLIGFLSELYDIATIDLVASFVDTFAKENNGMIKGKDKKLKLSVFDLLTEVPKLIPTNIIDCVIDMLKQRMPIPNLNKNHRIIANLSRISDASMLFFLEWFCNQVTDDYLLFATWNNFSNYVRDALLYPGLYKHYYVQIARVLSVYMIKLTDHQIFKDKKMKKDAEDMYLKLLDAIILSFNKVFESGSYDNILVSETQLGRNNTSKTSNSKGTRNVPKVNLMLNIDSQIDLESEDQINNINHNKNNTDLLESPVWATYETKSLSSSAGQAGNLSDNALVLDTIEFLIYLLSNFDKFISEYDRKSTIVSNIVYYLSGPLLKLKIPVFEEDLMKLLTTIGNNQYGCRNWKNLCWDIFNDVEYFKRGYIFSLRTKSFLKVLISIDIDKFKTEILSRISANMTTVIFGNKDTEIIAKCQLIRRLSYSILICDKNQFSDDLPIIHEKLVEILKSPFSLLHIEVYNCIRALLITVDSKYLTNLWPTVISVLIQLFSVSDPHNLINTDYTMYMILGTACKLLDLIFLLKTPDFQWHQWIFIEENKDYSSDISNRYYGLLDKISKNWTVNNNQIDSQVSTTSIEEEKSNKFKIPKVNTKMKSPLKDLDENGIKMPEDLSNSYNMVEPTSPGYHLRLSADNPKLILKEIGVPTYNELDLFFSNIGRNTFNSVCSKQEPNLSSLKSLIEQDLFTYSFGYKKE